MFKKPEIICFLLCVCSIFSVNGQHSVDSIRQLKSVVVTQSRLNDHVIAAYELPIDSVMLSMASNSSVTDLLRKQGLGHIRAYGPGGLALPSFRGTGSSHTVILWNGINLISPLTGQQDLSHIPVGLFDDATIQTGGSTSLAGNGSIGANIHLNNNINFNEGLRLSGSSHVGSFGSQFYSAGAQLSNERFGMSTRIFFNASENDFTFTNRSFNPPKVQRRKHSAFEQWGLMQQLHMQTLRSGIFSLKFWYQQNHNELPNPTGIATTSKANEKSDFYRAIVAWNFGKQKFDLNYQSALIRQSLYYSNPVIDLYDHNLYNSLIQNFETNVYMGSKSQLTTGIQHTWEEGEVDAFGNSIPERNRVAFFSAFRFQPFPKWTFAISGREEVVNGKPTPFSPTLSAKFQISETLNVFSNVSRNYRIPTFNDLYWSEAGAQGNPDLETETSIGGEAGFGFSNSVLTVKGVTFSNIVDDWILWTPGEGQVWSPQNIKKVWSRGIESQVSSSNKIGTIHFQVTGVYSFTKSTNEDIYQNGNQNEKGKQLLLTPLHEGSVTIQAEWRRYSLRIVNSYTGAQFNDSDNTPYNIVDDYLITNLWFSKVIELKNTKLTIIGEVNNAFDVEYVGRPGYPMPGINYKAGLQVNFLNKLN